MRLILEKDGELYEIVNEPDGCRECDLRVDRCTKWCKGAMDMSGWLPEGDHAVWRRIT